MYKQNEMLEMWFIVLKITAQPLKKDKSSYNAMSVIKIWLTLFICQILSALLYPDFSLSINFVPEKYLSVCGVWLCL